MKAEKEKKYQTRKNRKKTILILIPIVILALVLLLFVLLPSIVSSEGMKNMILSKINSSIDGKANFAKLTMGWLKGIKVTDISFKDNSGSTSVKVKRFATKPHYGSLLTGSLSFGKTIVEEPYIELNLSKMEKRDEVVNRDTVNNKSQTPIMPITRVDLIVNDGSIKVSDLEKELVELTQVNSNLNLRPPGQQTKLELDMAVVSDGKKSEIHTDGKIKPGKGWSWKGTSGELVVEVNELNLGSLEPLMELAGLDIQAKGLISTNLKGQIKDGKIEQLAGIIKGEQLDVTNPAFKGDRLKTELLDVDIQLKGEKEKINIDRLQIQADWLKADASGTIPTSSDSLSKFMEPGSKYDLKCDFECDVAALASQMPRTLGIKEATTITSGRMTGDIKTSMKQGQRYILGQVNLAELKGVMDGQVFSISEPVKINAEITSDKGGVKYDKLQVTSGFAKVDCRGDKDSLKYVADIDLGKLQKELGQFIDTHEYKIAGQASGKGEVLTSKNRITSAGSMSVKNLGLSKEGESAFEPQADIGFSFVADNEQNFISVDNLRIDASFGQVSVKDAVLPLENSKANMKLPIGGRVDLAKVMPFAKLFTSSLKEMRLAGLAESQMMITSKDNAYKIFTDSTKLTNFELISPGKTPFKQSQVLLALDAEINPIEKSKAIRKLLLTSPDIKIGLNAQETQTAGKTKMEGKADLEYDWAAVSSMASAFMPEGLKLEGKRKDSIKFNSQYPTGQTEKLLANLYTTKSQVGFDKAEYMGLNFDKTEVEAQIEGGLFTIAPFSSKVNNGQLAFAGQTDFKAVPTLLRTPKRIQMIKDVQINDKMSRKLLRYLNPLFAYSSNVSGIANFDCEQLEIPLAGASKKDLKVIGTVSLDKVRIGAAPFLKSLLLLFGKELHDQEMKFHPTRFTLQNEFLHYDDMQVDIGNNPVNFKGTIGVGQNNLLKMEITLPYTAEGRTAKVGDTDVKRITIPIGGTVDKPEADFGKVAQQLLEGQIKDRVQKKVEDAVKDALDKWLK